jgi:hypothetical protein
MQRGTNYAEQSNDENSRKSARNKTKRREKIMWNKRTKETDENQ